MKRVLMIGPFPPPNFGPAIRNKIISNELEKHFEVIRYDTKKKSYIGLMSLSYETYKADVIYLSVSKNGMVFLFPFMVLLCGILKKTKRIFVYPAGGTIDSQVINCNYLKREFFKYCFRKVGRVAVQTKSLAERLEKHLHKKVIVIPNPKPHRVPPDFIEQKISRDKSKRPDIRLLYLSRVKESKGVVDAIEVASILEKRMNVGIKLNIYGLVLDDFKCRFEELIKDYDFIEYHGTIDQPSQLIQSIACNDVMLFPSKWENEGFPGVVADAMLAGIPIVAYDHAYNSELIGDYETGIIVNDYNINKMANAVEEIISNHTLKEKLTLKAYEKSLSYLPSHCLTPLVNFVKACD